jgi:hypothetical protein
MWGSGMFFVNAPAQWARSVFTIFRCPQKPWKLGIALGMVILSNLFSVVVMVAPASGAVDRVANAYARLRPIAPDRMVSAYWGKRSR